MGKSLREFCTENGRDELLRQWDAEKNVTKRRMMFPAAAPQ